VVYKMLKEGRSTTINTELYTLFGGGSPKSPEAVYLSKLLEVAYLNFRGILRVKTL